MYLLHWVRTCFLTTTCIWTSAKDNLKLTGDLYSQGEKGAVFNDGAAFGSSHGVQAPHPVHGNDAVRGLRINGEEFSFDGGKGYLEMDYGFSFPERYLWSQCNWFAEADCRITCAVATLPFGAFRPRGCFACIDYGGRRISWRRIQVQRRI